MRFLFCSLDSIGFLFPAVGIAKALQRRGHEVVFVTNANQSQRLADLGLERIPRGANDGVSFQVSRWSDPVSAAIQVKHIEHALERFNPDALLGQVLTLGPLLVAERRRLPLGILGFCPYLWPVEDQLKGSSLAERRLHWRYGDMMSLLNKARDLFGLPPCEAGCRETPLLGDLFLQRSVSELQPEADRLPERVHFVGSCLSSPEAQSRDEELEAWLERARRSGTPILYVHHGKFFHVPVFWEAFVEALDGLEVQVAASVGQMAHPTGTLPNNFFVRAHIPQESVLRCARLLVASGNSTAFLGAIEAGVPSLLIPAGGEQEEVAEIGSRAGVALTLTPDGLTAGQIRAQIQELLRNPKYLNRAKQFREAFSKLDGPERAADLLEHLALVRGPVLRSTGLELPGQWNLGVPVTDQVPLSK